jgi:hypothetical protein
MSARINVFTIVLNGLPWIHSVHKSLHRALAQGLDLRWAIVHGVADPVADTSWCKTIPAPPDDGTLPYLREIAASSSGRITLICADRWPGKTAMCNAALDTFDQPGILMQMDADEVWTPAQLRVMPALFERHPQAQGAMFLCRYWVGPNRFVCTPNAFGNHCAYEWIRAWRFAPGMRFERHEPPMLIGAKDYASHSATAAMGLVFDHYAYATRAQIEFKRDYYGPEYSPEAWDRLQAMSGQVDLCGVLPWVKAPVISYEA